MSEVSDTLRDEAAKLPPATYWDNEIEDLERRLAELKGLKELRDQNHERLTKAAEAHEATNDKPAKAAAKEDTAEGGEDVEQKPKVVAKAASK